jgi:hypothetical protein
MDFQVILWIAVAVALVCTIVYSLSYSTKVDGQVDASHVAGKILSELQDRFFRDGNDQLVDVYQLGTRLGFSREQVRAALSEFEKDEQMDVVIVTERHVKLGVRGQMMRRPEGWSRSDRSGKLKKDT